MMGIEATLEFWEGQCLAQVSSWIWLPPPLQAFTPMKRPEA